MARIKGKDGVLRAGVNAVAQLKGWSIEETADSYQTQALGDTWKETRATYRSWSGSLEAYLDTADTGQGALVVGATVTAEFRAEGDGVGGLEYSGDIVITGRSITKSEDNDDMVSFTFVGDGALTAGTVSA